MKCLGYALIRAHPLKASPNFLRHQLEPSPMRIPLGMSLTLLSY